VVRPRPLRLLEVDPDLGQGLSPEEAAAARTELVASEVSVPRGPWDAEAAWDAVRPELGLLVVEGMLLRDISVSNRSTSELLGPGDLLRPWPNDRGLAALPVQLRFTALAPVRLAVLDRRFVTTAARWPPVLGEVTSRAIGRAWSASLRLMIHQLVRIQDRVLVTLWGLAERFGRVTSDGVLLPVPLNHEMIARLVGAHRPSVTSALGELRRAGAISRTPEGAWLLHGDAPTALTRDAQAATSAGG
jgi:CRP/FNR family cyclic AMP-dependent transcriptional regulator